PPPKTRDAYPAWLMRSTVLKVANGGTAVRVLRLRLLEGGAAMDSKEYLISAGGKVIAGGALSTDGRLEAVLTGNANEVIVEVPDVGLRQSLTVFQQSAFPSADTLVGAQLRLLNLGFYRGAADGERNETFDDAVAAFRQSQGLSPSRALDAETAAKLHYAYGS